MHQSKRQQLKPKRTAPKRKAPRCWTLECSEVATQAACRCNPRNTALELAKHAHHPISPCSQAAGHHYFAKLDSQALCKLLYSGSTSPASQKQGLEQFQLHNKKDQGTRCQQNTLLVWAALSNRTPQLLQLGVTFPVLPHQPLGKLAL